MAKNDDEKKKQLEALASKKNNKFAALISKIELAYGKGSVIKMDSVESIPMERIPTGSIGLTAITGGGYPRGRIIEIYGPESSGKTTLAIHAIAEMQKAGGAAGFIDAEHSFDKIYAANLGVDMSELLFAQPDNGEQGLEICDEFVRSGVIDIVVVDSVAALTPKVELEGDMGDSNMGVQARLMSQAMRKLTGSISRTNCLVIFINQLRDKIGVTFGSPETTTGGKALKFYASIRLDIRAIGQLKDNEQKNIGVRTRVKTVKNKTASPHQQCEFDIIYGQGIAFMNELLDLAVEKGIVKKSGSWFSYEDTKLGQGREAAIKILEDNFEVVEEIMKKIK